MVYIYYETEYKRSITFLENLTTRELPHVMGDERNGGSREGENGHAATMRRTAARVATQG